MDSGSVLACRASAVDQSGSVCRDRHVHDGVMSQQSLTGSYGMQIFSRAVGPREGRNKATGAKAEHFLRRAATGVNGPDTDLEGGQERMKTRGRRGADKGPPVRSPLQYKIYLIRSSNQSGKSLKYRTTSSNPALDRQISTPLPGPPTSRTWLYNSCSCAWVAAGWRLASH